MQLLLLTATFYALMYCCCYVSLYSLYELPFCTCTTQPTLSSVCSVKVYSTTFSIMWSVYWLFHRYLKHPLCISYLAFENLQTAGSNKSTNLKHCTLRHNPRFVISPLNLNLKRLILPQCVPWGIRNQMLLRITNLTKDGDVAHLKYFLCDIYRGSRDCWCLYVCVVNIQAVWGWYGNATTKTTTYLLPFHSLYTTLYYHHPYPFKQPIIFLLLAKLILLL